MTPRPLRTLAAVALLLTLLLPARPASAKSDWDINYQTGQQAYKNGPFGGKVAGFFNALTGGALVGTGGGGSGGKDSSGSASGGSAAPADANVSPGKDSIFPRRAEVEEARRQLSRDLVEKAPGSGGPGQEEGNSFARPDGSGVGLTPPGGAAAAGADPGSVTYGGHGRSRPGEAPVQDYYVPGLAGARPMTEAEIQRELQRSRNGGRAAAPAPSPQLPRGTFDEGPRYSDGRVAVPGMRKDADSAAGSRMDAYLRSARSKFRMGDWGGVLREAELALSVRPNAEGFTLKALALNRMAERAPREKRRALHLDAKKAALEAVRLAPDDAAAWEELGWAQLRLQEYADALYSADRALAINPRSAAAHYIRAAALEGLGRRGEGLQALEEAARLEPGQYGDRLNAAKEGRKIFDPDQDDSWQLLDDVTARRRRGPPLVLLFLGVATAAGAAFWALRRRRRKPPQTRSGLPRITVKAAPVEEEPRLAGKYELLRVIGKGGMGQVWEARDHSLGRTVAVKRIYLDDAPPGSEGRALYIKEARMLASLHHPHIVDIFEVLDLPEGLFFVFELLSGKTVAHLLAESKRLPLPRAREILRPVCQALDFAHGRSVVHRDLKPANIMVTDGGFVKVMDFGIARRIGEGSSAAAAGPAPVVAGLELARTMTVAGTPAYMPPESEQGIVSPASDVYSLGVVLYEMLVGERPFGAHALAQKLERAYARPSSRVQGLPSAADLLIDRALDPDFEKRLRSAKEFLGALDAL